MVLATLDMLLERAEQLLQTRVQCLESVRSMQLQMALLHTLRCLLRRPHQAPSLLKSRLRAAPISCFQQSNMSTNSDPMSVGVGSPCPRVDGLTFIKGGPVTIGEPDGRVKVVEAWATWCPPCEFSGLVEAFEALDAARLGRASIPHLTDLQRKYKDTATVIGISIEDPADLPKIKQFVDSMGDKMDYVVAVDSKGKFQRELYQKSGARGVPHAFVVGGDNIIKYSGHPMEPNFETALANAIRVAGKGQAEKKQQAMPPIMESYDQLMQHSAKELKGMLTDRGISAADCFEKSDLASKVVDRCSKGTLYK